MPLTTPMPEQAQKIAEILRRDVPRPEDLPAHTASTANCLRWDDGCCPMGLHPRANRICPYRIGDFPPDTSSAEGPSNIRVFANWWDAQTNAQAAVDAVWGEL